MLCLLAINTTNNQITLYSFVSIGANNMVNNCSQYSLSVQCQECNDGYHLDGGVCYRNVAGCISYIMNICVQCSGYSVLF
jgi:hypothetical protein